MLIDVQSVFCTDLVEIIDACAVFLIAARINAHNRVQTLAAAVHKAGDRQLLFTYDGVLARDIHAVGFNKRIAVFRDILVFHTLAV